MTGALDRGITAGKREAAMKLRLWLLMPGLALMLALLAGSGLAAASEVKYIDAPTLKGMMGDPSLVIIDTSTGWWTYDQKIPGSLVLPEEADTWAARFPKDKKIVLYCG